jgi:hypothetical protein
VTFMARARKRAGGQAASAIRGRQEAVVGPC